jgi:hypothetical protein
MARVTIKVDALAFNIYDLVIYRVSNKETGKEVARAKTGILIFDYGREKGSHTSRALQGGLGIETA